MKSRFTPQMLLHIVKQGIFAFGMFTAGAEAWQREASTIPIPIPILLSTAVRDLNVVAGRVAGLANGMMTGGSLQH